MRIEGEVLADEAELDNHECICSCRDHCSGKTCFFERLVASDMGCAGRSSDLVRAIDPDVRPDPIKRRVRGYQRSPPRLHGRQAKKSTMVPDSVTLFLTNEESSVRMQRRRKTSAQ